MKHLFFPIEPKYAERILDGASTVYVKPFFEGHYSGDVYFFYAMKPVCSVLGYATLDHIDWGRSPNTLWSRHNENICMTSREYKSHTNNRNIVAGIVFKNPKRIEPISETELRKYGLLNFLSCTDVGEKFLSLINKYNITKHIF